MDKYTINDILSYVNNDTKLVLNKVNSQYYMKVYTNNVYKANSIRLFKYIIENEKIELNRNTFQDICYYCDIDVVHFIISKGIKKWDWCKYWDWGLFGACKGCKLDTVKLMIEKGANDWNGGLYGACNRSNIYNKQLMISNGFTYWIWVSNDVCQERNFDIIKLMIEKGATECTYCRKSMEEHLKK